MVKSRKNKTQSDNELYKFLAGFYDQQGNNYLSVENFEKYLNNKKDKITPEEYNLLGCYYNKLYSDNTHDISDAKKSLDNFIKASDGNLSMRAYAKNATIMASKLNDKETGRKYWNRMFEINELNNDDKYDYAAYCLRYGDFAGWYKYSDSRFFKENNKMPFPEFSKPQWSGDIDISNSTLLVYFEQGFGDTFLMFGYMPRLKKLAKKVVFVVQNSVYPLLKNNDFDIEILAEADVDLDSLEFDYYIPAMNIPAVLHLNKDNICVGGGYIKVREELVKEFREKYCNNDKFKIGISFVGNNIGNRTRNIPSDEFLPLEDLENVEIYSLSIDAKDSDFECFKKHKVIDVIKSFNNFEQTASLIQNMDIVLTSDNCILNLSGALGKKTFALFNWNYEFRWFDLKGDNVVWYNCVKPFVNDKTDNWSSSIIPAVKEIKKLQSNIV